MLRKRNKLILYTFLYLFKNIKTKRSCWIHPYNSARREKGYFYTVCKDIEKYPLKFHSLFRMSHEIFQMILNLVKDDLRGVGTNYRKSISPKQKLCVTLIFLAHGVSFKKLSLDFRLGYSTINKIIKETCDILNKKLEPVFLAPETIDEWRKIWDDFLRLWQMPNCGGAIDGKHIHMFKPRKTGSKFFNYKKTFSIVLMAICDARYKFTMVDIGAYGSSSDGGVFSSSSFGKAWLNQDSSLQLPNDEPLPETHIKTPLALVADEAFPLRCNILRPYGGKNLTRKQKMFNYRLSRARRIIENSFGILCNTFRLLLTRMLVQPRFAVTVVKTCTILHNVLRDQEKIPERNIVLPSAPQGLSHDINEAIAIREAVATWFTSEGKVGFQDDHID